MAFLNEAQMAVFRTDVKVSASLDVEVSASYSGQDYDGMASIYNRVASPTVLLWRPRITSMELGGSVVWSEYATLSGSFQNCFSAMLAGGSVDATNSLIRGGFSTIFAGLTSLTNLTNLARSSGSRFQTLGGFLTGAGGAQVSSVYGHLLTREEVGVALYNPDGTPR